jgi:hypothetical protein
MAENVTIIPSGSYETVAITVDNITDNVTVNVSGSSEIVTINVSSDVGPAGFGVPSGGFANQILSKIDGVSYNTQWVNQVSSLPWGSLTGLISNQGDLQALLDSKATATGLAYEISRATGVEATLVSKSTTVNGHSLSSNITISASDVGLPNVTNDAQTRASIVPNTVPASGQILVGSSGGISYLPVSLGGDVTLSSAGIVTLNKVSGVPLGTAATTNSTNYATAAQGVKIDNVGGVSGLIKSNGFSLFSSATPGVDYLTPSGNGAGLTGITTSQLSDFNSAARTQTEAQIIAGANITLTPGGVGATKTLLISSVSGVTNVGGAGNVNGITLSGNITSSGNLTLGGTLLVSPSNFASQSAGTILAAPSGISGVPSFRPLVASDIPTLNYDVSGAAAAAQSYAIQRGNHTGSQSASTITDFNSAVRSQTEAELVAGANITITPSGTGDTRILTIASSGGGGSGTNLTTTASPTTVTINSDTGSDAIIAATDGTNAGLLLPAEKTKIANTSGTNTGDQDVSEMHKSISTGVYSFAGATLNSGDPTHKIDIPAALGYIVDNTGAHAVSPVITAISYAGQTAVSITNIATADATYFLVNSSGVLVQQTSHPTAQERRDNIFITKVAHTNRSTIVSINNTADYCVSPMSSLRDMFEAISLINDGIVCYPNGANLNFNTTAGNLYGMGINWSANPKAPNTVTVAAKVPAPFFYRTRTGGSTGLVSLIDPTSYDVGGTVTSIAGGGNTSTNQRVYLYPTGIINIQYGQTTYTSIANAIAGQKSETFVKAPNAVGSAILIGILTVRKGATDLSNSTHGVFTPASVFGESVGGVNGISTTTLQQAYDNSVTPEIATNATLGALSIRRGSGADTDAVFETLNGGGVVTFSVNGNGGVSGDINPSMPTTWIGLVTGAVPTGPIAISGGSVYSYNYGVSTRYRFINNAGTIDAFYANFDGTNLTNFVVSKSLQF